MWRVSQEAGSGPLFPCRNQPGAIMCKMQQAPTRFFRRPKRRQKLYRIKITRPLFAMNLVAVEALDIYAAFFYFARYLVSIEAIVVALLSGFCTLLFSSRLDQANVVSPLSLTFLVRPRPTYVVCCACQASQICALNDDAVSLHALLRLSAPCLLLGPSRDHA